MFAPKDTVDKGTYAYPVQSPEGAESQQLLSFYLGFIETWTKTLQAQLRAFFDTNPRTANFWNKVHIAEEWGTERQYYPAVIISGTTVNLQDLFLAKKMGTLSFLQKDGTERLIGERLGGRFKLSTTLKVGAFTTPDRDILHDLLMYGMVGPLGWSLMKEGFVWVANSGQSGPPTVEQPEKLGQAVHVRTLGFSVESEWFDDFYFNGVDISQINADISRVRIEPIQ